MNFLDENFLLNTDTARRLYHDVAAGLPIYDYHCHLSPADLACNRRFSDLYEIWLEGDHYKWRAMRANGVDETFITGNADPYDKFLAWARTVPNTLRNPLYQWSHLELRRYFGIDTQLCEETAREIWDEAAQQLKELDSHAILDRFQVALVGTTDDPAEPLDQHALISELKMDTRVYPTFRPDRAFTTKNIRNWNEYLDKLSGVASVTCNDLDGLLQAITVMHDRFARAGSRLSDHSFSHLPDVSYSDEQAELAFAKARNGKELTVGEREGLAMYLLRHTARLDAERGWTKQMHLGVVRNLNTRLFELHGADIGCDSMGDFRQGPGLHRFLDELDRESKLPQTILYNLNPSDNYLFATSLGNYQQGPAPGKMQWGSAWWYLDQKDGMTWQLNALSQLGLLCHFVGMLTDSRSMMSYPRHEYFRRILCGLIGEDAQRGEMPGDFDLLAKLVADVCFNNARAYFGFTLSPRYERAGNVMV